jgi:hypothetical protein
LTKRLAKLGGVNWTALNLWYLIIENIYNLILQNLPIEASEATQLVIDSLGRNLIWLDLTNGRIELANLKLITCI